MILDTNALSALFAGDATLNTLLSPTLRHHLPVVVIGEFRYGLLRSRHRDQLEPLLDNLVRELIVLRLDEVTAETYARVRYQLRERGRPMPENDVWIAALARQHNLPIVSRDRTFDDVPDLRRYAW